MIRVRVKQSDIDAGIAADCENCPVALALKRRFPRSEITVYTYSVWIGSRRYYKRKGSYKLQNFIYKFDAGDKVKPFSFCLY